MGGQGRIKIEQKNKNETKTREVIKKAPKKEEGQGKTREPGDKIRKLEKGIKKETKKKTKTREVIETAPKKEEGQGRIKIEQKNKNEIKDEAGQKKHAEVTVPTALGQLETKLASRG